MGAQAVKHGAAFAVASRVSAIASVTATVTATVILASASATWSSQARAEARPGDAPAGLDPADLTVPANQDQGRRQKPTGGRTAKVPESGSTPSPSRKSQPASQYSASDPALTRRWGGSLSLAFPHPLWAEAEHRFDPRWSAGLGLGGIGLRNISWDGIPLGLNMIAADVRGRWHPWDGSFFVGAALGIQRFSGAGSAVIPVAVSGSQTVNVPATVEGDIISAYLTPHAGWFHVFPSGFLIGFELGLQIPIAPSTEIAASVDATQLTAATGITEVEQTAQYRELYSQVDEAVRQLGKTVLPYVTLFRVGWMF